MADVDLLRGGKLAPFMIASTPDLNSSCTMF